MATRNFVPRANNEGGIGTSVKQWASGFFQKLAVGAITTAVTVLTPSDDANNQQPATTGWVRSQFQSILKTVLTAAGLKYNIATNGYICFGSLFGGLILQWGFFKGSNTIYYLPIRMNHPCAVIATNTANAYDELLTICIAANDSGADFSGNRVGIFGGGAKGAFLIALGF